MSELENNDQEEILIDEELSVEPNEPAAEPSADEIEALESGWNPKGEKTAAEWNRNKKLYDENHKLKKALRNNQKKMDEMLKMYRKQEEAAYKKAYDEIQAEKEAAISLGNRELVQRAEQKEQQLERPMPNEVIEFKEKYDDIFSSEDRQSKIIATWVKGRDAELFSRRLSVGEHFKILEQEMLDMFPELVEENSKSNKPLMVDSGNDGRIIGNNRKIYRWSDLTVDQKKVGIEFEKRGLFSKEEYVKELAKNGLIGK